MAQPLDPVSPPVPPRPPRRHRVPGQGPKPRRGGDDTGDTPRDDSDAPRERPEDESVPETPYRPHDPDDHEPLVDDYA